MMDVKLILIHIIFFGLFTYISNDIGQVIYHFTYNDVFPKYNFYDEGFWWFYHLLKREKLLQFYMVVGFVWISVLLTYYKVKRIFVLYSYLCTTTAIFHCWTQVTNAFEIELISTVLKHVASFASFFVVYYLCAGIVNSRITRLNEEMSAIEDEILGQTLRRTGIDDWTSEAAEIMTNIIREDRGESETCSLVVQDAPGASMDSLPILSPPSQVVGTLVSSSSDSGENGTLDSSSECCSDSATLYFMMVEKPAKRPAKRRRK